MKWWRRRERPSDVICELELFGYPQPKPPEIHWQAPGTSTRWPGVETFLRDGCGILIATRRASGYLRWRAPLDA